MIELTIHHADCQKCKVIENKLKAKNIDKENGNRMIIATEKTIQNIFNKIKTQIENSIHLNENVTIYCEDFLMYDYFHFSDQEWYKRCVNNIEIMEAIKSLFEDAGYEVSFKEYSNSWKTRSGKYGIFYIGW